MTTNATQMNAALPTEKEVMSKHLPPQQEEPEISNNHNNNNNNRYLLNVVHSAYAHKTAQKSTEFHMHAVDGFQATVCADGSSRDDSGGGGALRGHNQHQQESLEFSAEVVAFIQRGLQSPQQQLQQQLQSSENNGEDADSLEENGNEEDPSSAGCKELEARWLLAGEAVRAHLTSSAQAQDLQKLRATMQTDMARTAALKAELAELSGSSSMEVLRGQINKTFDRLNLMERSNLIAHAQYRSVLASLGSFREQALAVADAGVQHLSVQAEEVRSVRKDTQFGTVCLQVHQESMGRIEVSSVVVTVVNVVIVVTVIIVLPSSLIYNTVVCRLCPHTLLRNYKNILLSSGINSSKHWQRRRVCWSSCDLKLRGVQDCRLSSLKVKRYIHSHIYAHR